MGEKVCVTGAGGYVASWLVKLLLSKDYTVHATVRNPGDGVKYGHLHNLEKAAENLKLFKADLLDYESLVAAVEGCVGVFHVASPVPFTPVSNAQQAQKELLEPAVNGTVNVVKACCESNVKRLVMVSSVGAVVMNPNWPQDTEMDETCWSQDEYCIKTNDWYSLSKTLAEKEAFGHAEKSGLDVIAICPSLVLGPMLQHSPNATSSVLLTLLKVAAHASVENKSHIVVDVRDVAHSMLLVYETPEAEGRYICHAHAVSVREMVEMLKNMYPNYNYPKSFTVSEEEYKVSSQRLQGIGWSYRSLQETLRDSVESYRHAGILEV